MKCLFPSSWVHTPPAQPHIRHLSLSSLQEFYRIVSAYDFLFFSVSVVTTHPLVPLGSFQPSLVFLLALQKAKLGEAKLLQLEPT